MNATITWTGKRRGSTINVRTCEATRVLSSIASLPEHAMVLVVEADGERVFSSEEGILVAAIAREAWAAERAAVDAARCAEKDRVSAAAFAAERDAQRAKVRANLSAWLADRSSKPESMHAWLEDQARKAGLL